MRSLAEYSMRLPEDDYHSYPAWSYSLIARYAKDGFSSIATLHEPVSATPSMEFGSLLDTIVTKGKDEFEREYVVIDSSVPDAERKALDHIADRTDKPHARLDEIQVDDLMTYCDECGYYPRWGYDARLKHLKPYSDYYDALRTGRKAVSRTDFSDAMYMAKALWTSENTKDIFRKEGPGGAREFIYQAQFVESVLMDSGKEVLVKIMPDLLIVDHDAMTIQPVDLKTSSMPGWQFKDNFVKYRYDIQAGLYTDVIKLLIDKDADYRQYEVLPYIFADISRSDKIPVTYGYDPKEGFSFERDGKVYRYKGWMELLEEITGYEESGAVVPSNISLTKSNNIIDLLSR